MYCTDCLDVYYVLAICYVAQNFFATTDPVVLDWKRRQTQMLAVLDALDADVLCLQVSVVFYTCNIIYLPKKIG